MFGQATEKASLVTQLISLGASISALDFLLLTFLLFITVTCLLQRQTQSQLKQTLQELDERIHYQNTELGEAIEILAKYAKKQNRELQQLDQKQLELSGKQSDDLAYTQVSKLLNMGVETEQLLGFGLSSTEANLANLIHQNQH